MSTNLEFNAIHVGVMAFTERLFIYFIYFPLLFFPTKTFLTLQLLQYSVLNGFNFQDLNNFRNISAPSLELQVVKYKFIASCNI